MIETSRSRKWCRKKDPEFNTAIEGGCTEMVAEMASRAMELARQGDATMIRYLLDRRAEAFKPKSSLDHTSNGNTLAALLAEHGEMSDEEARERGLIYDAEDGPLIEDVDYKETPHADEPEDEGRDDFDEDGRPMTDRPDDDAHMRDLRRRGLIYD